MGSLILGGLSKALAKAPADPGAGLDAGSVFAAQGRNLTVRQPIAPWQVVVGETRTGGVLTFAHMSTGKTYFHLVVTLACHESAAIAEVILNDEVITADQRDASGNVQSGFYATALPTARAESFTVPGSPYAVTTAHTVGSVQSVTATVITPGWYGPETSSIALQDVSPGSPAAANEYSRSGDDFTFHSTRQGDTVYINYTENATQSNLRIQTSLGDETYGTQPFPDLVAESEGKWTAAHRQDGHTKIYLRFAVATLRTLGSIPQISVVMRGLKHYDPRSATTHYAPNPALAVSTYLTDDEFGFDTSYADEVEADALTAAANLCEERVQVGGTGAAFTGDASLDAALLEDGARTPRTGDGVRLTTTGTLPGGLSTGTTYYAVRQGPGQVGLASSYANAMAGTLIDITGAGSGTHTLTPYDEARYTANGTFLVSERRGDVIERLLAAMAGRGAHVSDRWWLFGGAYEAATVTLDESELAGGIRIDPLPASADSANGVKGVFVDPSTWQPTDFPAVSSAAYLSRDGDERQWVDLDLTGFVTSAATAQRLAKIELRRRRFALAFTATFQLSAWRAMTARTIAMDFAKFGWAASAQEFEVTNQRFVVIPGDGEAGGPSLGIELACRQSDSAIWDWSLSEEQALAAISSTSLPNPAANDPPGAPVVTEALYETSGSAGVKNRVALVWGAPADALVQSYNLRYKEARDADYTLLPSRSGLTAQIDDIAPGVYIFGVQGVNTFGEPSTWASTVKEVLGLTAPPANMTGAALSSLNGGQAELSWTRSADLDVRIGGRVVWRWTPKTSGGIWNDGVEIANVPGGDITARVAHLTGTYLGKFRDSSGNESAASNDVVTTTPDVAGFNAIQTLTEDSGFAGAKSGCLVIDSKLTLDGGVLIDDMTDAIDDWGYIDSAGGVAASGTYDFDDVVDLAAVYTSRVTATLKTLSVDTDDLIDARLDPIDSWGLVDGPEISDVNAQLFVATTEDDPAGTPTWSAWRPFFVGDYRARGLKFRLVLSSDNLNHNIQVINLGVAVDMPDREDAARNVSSGAGTKSVSYTLSPVFKALPKLGITAKDMVSGDWFAISNEAVDGFDILFKDSGGSAVDRTFDWRAKGY